MNLLHIKYAVEIADTNSMTKAAERLFTTQPNLSRAIRELESNLGITIFKRTPKGIYPTPQGEEFLLYARKVLSQVDEIEAMYRVGSKKALQFSVSVPRASYISSAFTRFVQKLPKDSPIEVFYKETNSMRAINNIVNADYRLGVLRYQASYESKFHDMLKEKGLKGEPVYDFRHMLLMSANCPLAQKANICINDLTPYTEIAHADPFVPSLPLSTVRKNELMDDVQRHIYVFERGSQMDILCDTSDSFMWVSPIPQHMLDRYDLVQRCCVDNDRLYRDLLIYRRDYRMNDIDTLFVNELNEVRNSLPNT